MAPALPGRWNCVGQVHGVRRTIRGLAGRGVQQRVAVDSQGGGGAACGASSAGLVCRTQPGQCIQLLASPILGRRSSADGSPLAARPPSRPCQQWQRSTVCQAGSTGVPPAPGLASQLAAALGRLQRSMRLAAKTLSALVDTPLMRAVSQWSQFAASMLFVVLYVYASYHPPVPMSWRHKLDLLLCVFFAAEYFHRFTVSPAGVAVVLLLLLLMMLVSPPPMVAVRCEGCEVLLVLLRCRCCCCRTGGCDAGMLPLPPMPCSCSCR